MSGYDLKKPCANCPFRTCDGAVRLTKARAREIAEHDGEFPCHKTTVPSRYDDGELVETVKSQMCAGFLIFREKQEHPNQMMRIAERLGMYDPSKLDRDAFDEVVDDWQEMALRPSRKKARS